MAPVKTKVRQDIAWFPDIFFDITAILYVGVNELPNDKPPHDTESYCQELLY